MYTVTKARPFDEKQTGMFARADQMLIRQYNFPWEYPAEEHNCLTKPSQGLTEYREEFWEEEIKEYGIKPDNFGKWLVDKNTPSEQILECVIRLLKEKVDSIKKWTGFRILGTTGKAGLLFIFELFAQPEDSKTVVYSDYEAPNVG